MSLIANTLYTYLQDSTFFGQNDAKAIRQQTSVINEAVQWLYANSTLKNIEEYGRVQTVPAIASVSGIVATSGSVNLTFHHQTLFTAFDSSLSGQYISIGDAARWHLIEDIPTTSGLTLNSNYPYLGSGETSGTYTIFYPVSELPSGIETINDPKNEFYLHSQQYISPQAWLNFVRNVGTVLTSPQYYTLMRNQITNKFSLFYWPAPNEARTIDFNYWRYPTTINNGSDTVDWPEEDLWVLKSAMKMFAVQYMNFGEDESARLKWFHTYKKEAQMALSTIKAKNFRRVDLGNVGSSNGNNTDVLSRDLRRYPNNP